MCGYAGFYLNRKRTPHGEMEKTITKMANSLEHRGPDDLGSDTMYRHSAARSPVKCEA
jgi:asparagine synthetase B (glutamine-hydrolysing)